MSPGRLCNPAVGKALDRCAKMRSEDPGITDFGPKSVSNGDRVARQFIKACCEPLVTYIHTYNQPQPGHARVSKQESCYGRFRNVCYFPWLDILTDTHDVILLFRTECFDTHTTVRLTSKFFRSFTQSITSSPHDLITAMTGFLTEKSRALGGDEFSLASRCG